MKTGTGSVLILDLKVACLQVDIKASINFH